MTTPLGNTANGPGTVNPRPTAFLIGSPPPVGLAVGSSAPEFSVPQPDGSTYQLPDLNGAPIRLADLRGKAVWVDFWATWCPPCQAEVPILREMSERYKDRGLVVVAISVQETSPARRGLIRRPVRPRLHDRVRWRRRTSSIPTGATRCRPSSSSTRTASSPASSARRLDEAEAISQIEAIRCRRRARPHRPAVTAVAIAVAVAVETEDRDLARLVAEPVAVADEVDRSGARPRGTGRPASPRRPPVRTQLQLATHRIQRVVVVRGHPSRIGRPRTHEQVAEEGQRPGAVTDPLTTTRLVARRVAARRARPSRPR